MSYSCAEDVARRAAHSLRTGMLAVMHSSPRTPLIDPQLTAWVKDRAQAVVVYRRVALYTFLTVMMGVTGVLLIWPRTYHSQAKLFVRLGRESVALDPTVTTGATIALSDTREHEINSVMEMIRNRAVFEDVVRVLGAEVILGDSAVPDMAVVDQRISEAFISPAMTTLATGRPTPEV